MSNDDFKNERLTMSTRTINTLIIAALMLIITAFLSISTFGPFIGTVLFLSVYALGAFIAFLICVFSQRKRLVKMDKSDRNLELGCYLGITIFWFFSVAIYVGSEVLHRWYDWKHPKTK